MQLRKCCNHPYLLAGVEDEMNEELNNDEARMEHMINCSGKMLYLDKLLSTCKHPIKLLIFS